MYNDMEPETTGSHAVRKEESQRTYSVLHQDTASDVVLCKSSSQFNSFEDKDKRWKSAVTISQLYLVIMVISILFLVLATAVAISVGLSYTMISRLRSEVSSAQSNAPNISLDDEQLNSVPCELEHLQNSSYINFIQLSESKKDVKSINMSIVSIFQTLAGLNSNSSHLQGLINEINNSNFNLLNLVSQLTENVTLNRASLNQYINLIPNTTLGQSQFYPAPSCQVIHTLQPYSVSGLYWVRSSNGSSIHVYCDMTKSCGNVTGGLTRVVLLNDETRPLICTGDFETSDHETRCVRNTEDPGCSHIIFPLMNVTYSHICGTVESSYFGHPDGFTGSSRSPSTSINDNYVDGISLTYGDTPNRNHIRTFVADEGASNCSRAKPQYVKNNYSCLKWVDLCQSSANACTFTFFRQLQQPFTEIIEMRLCRDQHRSSEGIYVENVKIYVW